MTVCAHEGCGAVLHKRAAPPLDEWVYVDDDGRGYVPGTLAERVAELYDALTTWHVEHREPAPAWLSGTYSAMSCALTLGCGPGHGHEHRPRLESGTAQVREVPEHCGWPMRLRPSGWHCRICQVFLRVGLDSADPAW